MEVKITEDEIIIAESRELKATIRMKQIVANFKVIKWHISIQRISRNILAKSFANMLGPVMPYCLFVCMCVCPLTHIPIHP